MKPGADRPLSFNPAVWVMAGFLAILFCLNPALAADKHKVIVFHAGSLTVPLAQIEKDFEAANPDIDILREAGGSTKMARMISELGKPADIMASADFKVIDKSLIPDFADWNIRFSANQLVLCYTAQSRHADQINADNLAPGAPVRLTIDPAHIHFIDAA